MSIQTVEISLPESIIKIIEVRQGPAGADGSGSNNITSATTSNGTADLDLLNVDTVTATVTGTLTADHIHGNLAGSVYAHIRAGEALTKGDPVYVSGSHGSGSTLIPIVSKADASNAAKMPAVGIMDAAVANNANGHMVIVGTITELNTAGYTVNAELYVKAGGGMTATPPTARAQPVARVERVNANNGAVIVKVNGLSASDATASTLVRRDGMGSASFSQLATTGMVADGSIAFNGTDAIDSLAFNMVYYTYGAGAASAHLIALGVGTTGSELFGAATPAAARTTLGLGAFSTNGSITGTGALTFAAGGSNQNINLTPSGTGTVSTGATVVITKSGTAGFNIRNTGATFTNSVAVGGVGNINLYANWDAITNSQSDTSKVSLAVRLRVDTDSWQFVRVAAGAGTAETIPFSVSGAGAVESLYQRFGSGTPEGVVTAPVGAVFHRTNGGAGTSFYVKESGTGNTGWVAK